MRYLIFALILLFGCIQSNQTAPASPETINSSPGTTVNASQPIVPAPPASPGTNTTPPAANYTIRLVTYSTSPYELRGFLYVPSGDGPFPAIIYNHGSEPEPGTKKSIASFFAEKGYVVFVPHRRGQGMSSGPSIQEATAGIPPSGIESAFVEGMVNETDDVAAAVSYVQSLSYVDDSRLSMLGCSYGGIETVLSAERPLGLKAAVDFAGASESWEGHAILQERLKQAVDDSLVPIFFLQAENDYNTQPTKELSAEMTANNVNHQAVQSNIYPPYGSTPQEGHGGFCGDPKVWGSDVLSFLEAHGAG
jgi:carboxymethylenebutenolidase